MKPDLQKIAIAKVCNYSVVPEDGGYALYLAGNPDRLAYEKKESRAWSFAPDYPSDLNAMHEVEANYPWNEDGNPTYNDYIETLKEVHGSEFSAFSAPSKKRAEAFLKTIGKWEGEQS